MVKGSDSRGHLRRADVWVGMGSSGRGKRVGKRLAVLFKMQSEDRNHSHSNRDILTE